MIPVIIETGIVLFLIIQVIVALVAIILAINWKKNEMLAGLSFLFIYTILDLVGVAYSLVIPGEYIDVAQFGFILLAIVFFIVGMHPSWRARGAPGKEKSGNKTGSTAIFTHLKKI